MKKHLHLNFLRCFPGSFGGLSLLVFLALTLAYPHLAGAQQCQINDIVVSDISPCDDNGTADPTDDDFTATITVTYSDAPNTGFLVVGGDATLSVDVSQIGSGSYAFQSVTMPAEGTPQPISLTAYFSSLPQCSLSLGNLGMPPSQCSGEICNPPGSSGTYPVCFAQEGPNLPECEESLEYAPDPDNPELTPLKYVRTVVHIFQTEEPDNPQNFTESDIDIIRSWFDGIGGINDYLGNLCDDPYDSSPHMTDARFRLFNKGIIGEDVFFHHDNRGWAYSFYSAPNNSNCAGPVQPRHFPDDMNNLYVTGDNGGFHPSLTPQEIATLSSPDIQNAYHVFICRGRWRDCNSNGLVDINIDKFDFFPGGVTQPQFFNCENGVAHPNPTAAFYGYFDMYKMMTDPNFVPISNITVMPTTVPALGRGLIGELYHLMGVDHISPFRAHWTHSNGDDGCDDTPWDSDANVLGCNFTLNPGTKCALTQCQLGKIHYVFENNAPPFVRFPEGSTEPNPVGQGQFNMEGNCDINLPDIVIKDGENIVWNSRRQLRSNVLVESGGKLTIRCDLGMPENANITVEENGQLVVDGARVYSNCDGQYWQGIYVYGGGDGKPQAYDILNDTRYVGWCSLYDAVIENAVIGVWAGKPNNDFKNGGLIRASGSTFLNCKRHAAFFPSFQNEDLAGNPIGNLSFFNNCHFEVNADDGGNIADFVSMVKLQKVDGVTFRACDFLNEFPHNQSFADDRKIGIEAVNAGFRVFGLCALDPIPPDCGDFNHSTFEGFAYGIHSGIYGTANTFQVSRATFSDNLVGIYASGAPNADVNRCEFRVGSTLPVNTQNNSENANRGIHLYGCTGYRVEGNTLRGLDVGDLPGTTNPVGILIRASGEEPNEVYRNTLDSLYVGNLSNGQNRSSFNSDLGLQYLCNTNGITDVNDFDFAVPFAKGTSVKGIAGLQGSAGLAARNVFSIVTGSSEPEMHFLNEEAPFEYFYLNIQNHEPTNYTTSTITKTNSSDPNNSCPSGLPGGGEEGILDETSKQQLEQAFINTTDNVEQKKIANQLIRYYLLDQDSQDLSAARTWLNNKNTLYSHFTIVETYLQESNTTGAQQALNNIPNQFSLSGESQTEYNHFNTLKSIQISALQNGTTDAQLVAANQAALTQVADAGEYYASKQAKLLLNEVNGETYFPEVNLPDGNQQNMMAPPPSGSTISVEANSVVAVPNPAKDMAVFHYSLQEESNNSKLLVQSVDGRTVWQSELDGQSGTVRWDLGSLTEGIYFYHLVMDGKAIFTEKLVIVR